MEQKLMSKGIPLTRVANQIEIETAKPIRSSGPSAFSAVKTLFRFNKDWTAENAENAETAGITWSSKGIPLPRWLTKSKSRPQNRFGPPRSPRLKLCFGSTRIGPRRGELGDQWD